MKASSRKSNQCNQRSEKSGFVVSTLVTNLALPRGWSAWKNNAGNVFYFDGTRRLFTWTKPRQQGQ